KLAFYLTNAVELQSSGVVIHRKKAQRLKDYPWRTSFLEDVEDLSSVFDDKERAETPLATQFLSNLAHFEARLFSESVHVNDSDLVALRDAVSYTTYHSASEVLPWPKSKDHRRYGNLCSILTGYRVAEMFLKSAALVRPRQEIHGRTELIGHDTVYSKAWKQMWDLESLVQNFSSLFASKPNEDSILPKDAISDTRLYHLHNITRYATSIKSANIAFNFSMAAAHAHYLATQKFVGCIPDLPEQAQDFFQAISQTTSHPTAISGNEAKILKNLAEESDINNLRTPLELAIHVTPLALLLPKDLCKASISRVFILEAAMALGNQTLAEVLVLEDLTREALLKIIAGRETVSFALYNLSRQLSQHLPTCVLEPKFKSWFTLKSHGGPCPQPSTSSSIVENPKMNDGSGAPLDFSVAPQVTGQPIQHATNANANPALGVHQSPFDISGSKPVGDSEPPLSGSSQMSPPPDACIGDGPNTSVNTVTRAVDPKFIQTVHKEVMGADDTSAMEIDHEDQFPAQTSRERGQDDGYGIPGTYPSDVGSMDGDNSDDKDREEEIEEMDANKMVEDARSEGQHEDDNMKDDENDDRSLQSDEYNDNKTEEEEDDKKTGARKITIPNRGPRRRSTRSKASSKVPPSKASGKAAVSSKISVNNTVKQVVNVPIPSVSAIVPQEIYIDDDAEDNSAPKLCISDIVVRHSSSRSYTLYGPNVSTTFYYQAVAHFKTELAHQERLLDALENFYEGGLPLHIAKPDDSCFKILSRAEFEMLRPSEVQRLLQQHCLVIPDYTTTRHEWTEEGLRSLAPLTRTTTIQDLSQKPGKNGYNNRHRIGTLRDMLDATRNPEGKILNGLYFPGERLGDVDYPFSSELFAWRMTESRADCSSDGERPVSTLRWGLAATSGARHGWHVDSNGLGTYIDFFGLKLWCVAAGADLSRTRVFLDKFDTDEVSSSLGRIEGILCVPGMRLIMPPRVLHSVVTIQHAICHGGHFYSLHLMHRTLCALIHILVTGDVITNNDHTSSPLLLRRMLAFCHEVWIRSRKARHEPYVSEHSIILTEFHGFLNFMALINIHIFGDALDVRHYQTPRSISPKDDQYIMHFRGMAINMALWFARQYMILDRKTHQELDPLSDVIFPHLARQGRALIKYKQNAASKVPSEVEFSHVEIEAHLSDIFARHSIIETAWNAAEEGDSLDWPSDRPLDIIARTHPLPENANLDRIKNYVEAGAPSSNRKRKYEQL
ncbi:hypothetical protein CVT24_006482, partial [Panaeolus cyanescens]